VFLLLSLGRGEKREGGERRVRWVQDKEERERGEEGYRKRKKK
jgi:hypothetical protein